MGESEWIRKKMKLKLVLKIIDKNSLKKRRKKKEILEEKKQSLSHIYAFWFVHQDFVCVCVSDCIYFFELIYFKCIFCFLFDLINFIFLNLNLFELSLFFISLSFLSSFQYLFSFSILLFFLTYNILSIS